MDKIEKENRTGWGELIIRFIISAIVLMVTAFFSPGFAVAGFWTALIQSVVIVGLDYLIEMITGIDASPLERGFIGFIVSTLIIYATQFIVPGVSVTIPGAIIASLIIGLIDAFLPIRLM